MIDLLKITMNLTPQARAALNKTVERDMLTKTDAMNRAIRFYNRIMEEMEHQGVGEVTVGTKTFEVFL